MDQNNNINELVNTFRGLQQRLLQEIINSHAETEMTLKQLVAYLNVSAQNLTEVHNIVSQFNATVDALKFISENNCKKIDNLEDKIDELPSEATKLKELMNDNYAEQTQKISTYLSQTNTYLKQLYATVNQQNARTKNLEDSLATVIKTIEKDLNKNHENLTGIITTLIENRAEIDTKTLDVKEKSSGETTKKYEIKLKFWGKVIGIFFASGGFLYTIIDLIIKNIRK